ncbi:heavy metal translocating P-type ATPase [Saccharospirillum mangrovi]|uniref:heavy metal translocating P-type ATPase n=1 Tax=Saccharospirillum mangrovi TaxID=2161747 RepID=UPI000D36693C|nr:heavy metal translocating P-type ATPase [Saccharospirillum mangrovi]
MTQPCFHCGLPAFDERFQLEVGGDAKVFCCVGCLAAAQTILDAGLGEYYRFHDPDQTPAAPPVSDRDREQLALYDRDDVQSEFVQRLDSGDCQATLMIDGVSCAACSWLIEKRLYQQAGVAEARFNQTTHRLLLRWKPGDAALSTLFVALHSLGYRAQPYQADAEEALRQKTGRRYLLRLGVAGIGMMQAMMNAVALYSGSIEATYVHWLRWTSLFITLPVVIIGAGPYFTAAWRALKSRSLSMDVSVSLAIGGAFAASVWATVTRQGEVYFESVSMFTFFLVLGRFLEFRARTSVHASSNALARQLPPTCRVRVGDDYQQRPVRDLVVGDVIQVRAGELCPVDGRLVHGASEFDESRLTGEVAPQPKAPGGNVLAGTTNLSQAVDIEVERLGADSSASALTQLLERASSEKPRLAELADRGARHFVLSTLLITALIGLAWLWIEPDRAFWIVISVLVVTCPCALSLATPTVLAQATQSLAKEGLIVTRGHTLERLADITDIAFDKTGTLTEGRFRLIETELTRTAQDTGLTNDSALRLAAALEADSDHPLARAFRDAAQGLPLPAIDDRTLHPSAGVSGRDAQSAYRLGTAQFALTESPADAQQPGTLWLSRDGVALARFQLADEIRSTAATALQQLSALGLRCHVLTGDPNPQTDTRLTALALNGDYHANLSAADKLNWLHEQQAHGRHIAMVGDGINDAPVLAGAPVSIALASGTDLAKQASDALLLNDQLTVLASAIRAARKTRRVIRQNLWWALVYNGVALPLAALGWVTPWQAAIGMSASSLLVVLNALRLRRLN